MHPSRPSARLRRVLTSTRAGSLRRIRAVGPQGVRSGPPDRFPTVVQVSSVTSPRHPLTSTAGSSYSKKNGSKLLRSMLKKTPHFATYKMRREAAELASNMGYERLATALLGGHVAILCKARQFDRLPGGTPSCNGGSSRSKRAPSDACGVPARGAGGPSLHLLPLVRQPSRRAPHPGVGTLAPWNGCPKSVTL